MRLVAVAGVIFTLAVKRLVAAVVLAMAVSACAPASYPRPFASDGCSLFPDGDWVDCCTEHDREYWWGGSYAARVASDTKLATCVEAKGHAVAAQVMYVGVRAGGMCALPLPFRWGYGWRWPACEGGE